MCLIKGLPLVSVIVLNFNGASYLENCLSSLLKTTYPNFEVILVDNASTDNSVSIVKRGFGTDKRLRIVKSGRNLGFSEGNNLGFQHSAGDYIVFLNNDTVVAPDWLLHLVEGMQADSSIGLAQSLILTIDGSRIQTAGWVFSDYLVYQYPLMEKKEKHIKLRNPIEVSFASGAAMIVSRSLISEIGLFDSSTPFFHDDTLLSLKTWLANKRVVTFPNSVVYHFGGATMEWNTYFHTIHALRGKICLLFDVYSNRVDLAKGFFVFGILQLLEIMSSIQKRSPTVALANIESFKWMLTNFRHIWSNGLKHWSSAKISSKELVQKFVRIKLPTALYLARSKSSFMFYKQKIAKYEEKLTSN